MAIHQRPFQVRRFPGWIRKALNLIDTQVPAALYSERDEHGKPYAPIVTIIDAFQGGVAIGDPITMTGTVAPGQFLNLATGGSAAPGDQNISYVVFGVSLLASALAATRNPVFAQAPLQPFALDIGIRVATAPIATAATLSWVQLMNRGDVFYTLPGYVPVLYANDLGAGETLQVFASLQAIPAGFKPF